LKPERGQTERRESRGGSSERRYILRGKQRISEVSTFWDSRMIDENSEESDCGLIDVLSPHLLGVTE
jgi:hypothetical protein